MNIINNCEGYYIRANRTVETISFKNIDRFMYVYNYKGNHFRVFTEITDLIAFFQFGKEPKNSFFKESQLDEFIANFKWD